MVKTRTESVIEFLCRNFDTQFGDVKAHTTIVRHDGQLKKSHTSFSFIDEEKQTECLNGHINTHDVVYEHLTNIFGLKDCDELKTRFDQAISGKGQELGTIHRLHSSSLLAFLMFCQVSDSNPLTIDGVEYTQSFFEVQTKVISQPSNMDVVLISKDKKTALFLESKFCEYIENQNYEISIAYKDYYQKLGFWNEEEHKGILCSTMEICESTDKDHQPCLKIISTDQSNNGPHYCDGMKQLLSHYIGVSNYKNGCSKALSAGEAIPETENILMGEIVFDFRGLDLIENAETCFNNYATAYQEVVAKLNQQDGEHPKVRPTLLTYQEMLKENPNYCMSLEKVLRYYCIEMA